MTRPLVAVVLAGGTGTRLFPASTPERPKQFLDLGGDRSLLRRTVDRAGFADEVYVVTRQSLAEAVRAEVPEAAVLTEPAPRDTGPALVYATDRIRNQIGDCVVAVLPSDHHIAGPFAETIETAAATAAETGGLVTIGIEPTRPATGYGYIEPADRSTPDGAVPVEQFVEKPDREAARRYREKGWYWNAGVFCWRPEALLAAAKDSPLADLVVAVERGAAEQGFETVDAVSVDTAVLERAENVFVVPATFEWDDLGDWDAVGRVLPADEDGNVCVGESLPIDSTGCVLATDGQVSVVGVDDLVVASYGDRTLVVPREQSQAVRDVVERLGSTSSTES